MLGKGVFSSIRIEGGFVSGVESLTGRFVAWNSGFGGILCWVEGSRVKGAVMEKGEGGVGRGRGLLHFERCMVYELIFIAQVCINFIF